MISNVYNTFLNAHELEGEKNCFCCKVPYIQVVQDRPSWQVNYHTSNQNEQYFSNANIPCQRLHPLQSWSFYDGQVLCEYTLVRVMNSKLINNSQPIYVRACLPFLLQENIPQWSMYHIFCYSCQCSTWAIWNYSVKCHHIWMVKSW